MHPKVKSGGATGAVTVLVSWIVSKYGVTVPPEVAAAVTALASVAVSYFTPAPPTA